MKKALLYVLFALLALVLTTAIAIYLIVRVALTPSPDEWSTEVKVGPATLSVGVPTAIRLATSTWVGPWIDGRTFETRHGPVQVAWTESNQTLTLQCVPCNATIPALSTSPVRLDSLKVAARRDGANLRGTLEAAPAAAAPGARAAAGDNTLRARWDGRLTQKTLQLNIDVAEAPIARWYTVLAPALPELQRARIEGSLGLRAQIAMPGASFTVMPQLSQFTVEGLGTEQMLNARSSCGAPGRLASDSWIARTVLAAEDQRFYTHPGFDLAEMLASLDSNQKAARIERGGSTLTQQLARLLVTGSDRTIERKLRELLYAVEMEQTLGKARILQLYLDNAPWGDGLCGAEAASRKYFKRPARNLEPVQAVWLAAMLNNPDVALARWRRDGTIDPERAKWVADGVRNISRPQRDALLKNVVGARFPAP